MTNLFNGATSANPDTSSWDVGNVTSMTNIFTNSGISDENYTKFLVMAANTSSANGMNIWNVPAGYYDSAAEASAAREESFEFYHETIQGVNYAQNAEPRYYGDAWTVADVPGC